MTRVEPAKQRLSMFSHNEAAILAISGCYAIRIDRCGRIWRRAQRSNAKAGRVFGRIYRAELKTGNGYLQVSATIGGRRYSATAHRLVWIRFRGPIPDGLTINHKNGIKSDNRLANLEVVTQSENMLHAYRVLGVANHVRGEQHPHCKLTGNQVRAIYLRYVDGDPTRYIAAEFGVSTFLVNSIGRGEHRTREALAEVG